MSRRGPRSHGLLGVGGARTLGCHSTHEGEAAAIVLVKPADLGSVTSHIGNRLQRTLHEAINGTPRR